MSFSDLLFWVFAIVAVGAAGMILISRGIVHMAFWLLASLAGFAGLYLHLGADFLGFTQVVVYIGGILILFLFGVMLTYRADIPVRRYVPPRVLLPGVLTGVALLGFCVWVAAATPWKERPATAVPTLGPVDPAAVEAGTAAAGAQPTARAIGELFMSRYILPFEVVSVLLLVAMIGATFIIRSREDSSRGVGE